MEMNNRKLGLFILAVLFAGLNIAHAQTEINIDLQKKGIKTSKDLYGIFFEEINHSGDGGLYSEMVKNRDFETVNIPQNSMWGGNIMMTRAGWKERKWFGNELDGWEMVADGETKGDISLQKENSLNIKNPHYLELEVLEMGKKTGLVNNGYWGMHFKNSSVYLLSFYAQTSDNEVFDVNIALQNTDGSKTFSKSEIKNVGGNWKRYEVKLKTKGESIHGRLFLSINKPGRINFDVVSLFPEDTYNKRPNGLRADLVEMLKQLQPSFLRFPGGAIVGGMNLDNRIQWKNSIGDIAQRKGTANLWGYYTTNGLGYHEYLLMCEDLNVDGLWVCNPGFSDNWRNPEFAQPEELQNYINEAMDALEYALGPVDSEWGKKRAENGHPEPFNLLKYIEIGNEASGDVYKKNYKLFCDAIKAKYPTIKIISNLNKIENAPVEIVDHHKYGTPTQFFKDFYRYDEEDRNGPNIYVGEYGCKIGVGEGNLMAALSEAVYLMGLERNSDIVTMSSYAPLFFNVNDIQWEVNMIGFDNHGVFGRSSFYAHKMLAENRADIMLDSEQIPLVDGKHGKEQSIYSIAGYDEEANEIVIKVVNRSSEKSKVQFNLKGVKTYDENIQVITLQNDEPTQENSITFPHRIVPGETNFRASGNNFTYDILPYSFTVLRLNLNR